MLEIACYIQLPSVGGYILLPNVEDCYSPIIFCCLLLEFPAVFCYLMLVIVSLPLYTAS